MADRKNNFGNTEKDLAQGAINVLVNAARQNIAAIRYDAAAIHQFTAVNQSFIPEHIYETINRMFVAIEDAEHAMGKLDLEVNELFDTLNAREKSQERKAAATEERTSPSTAKELQAMSDLGDDFDEDQPELDPDFDFDLDE